MKICSNCHQHHSDDSCPHCSDRILPTNKIALSVLLGVGLMGCLPTTQAMYGVPTVDNDEDGFMDYEDCNDNDANTYPGAAIEDSESACMTDADGDGYGAIFPGDYIEGGSDCDDTDPEVNPGNENCRGEE